MRGKSKNEKSQENVRHDEAPKYAQWEHRKGGREKRKKEVVTEN